MFVTGKVEEKDSFLMRWARVGYQPALDFALRTRSLMIGIAVVLVLLTALAIGLIIGFYDGVLGPGTGTFLVISLVAMLGYDFLQASAKAKIVNLATNLGAIAFFLPSGHILVGLGLILGLSNMVGGYLGARMAVRQGAGFIRIVFLCVVSVLIAKLGWDLFVEWTA